ncbi:MAG: hypothetical protein IPP79_08045 [Chitinophagaceae bacterium]|nr:hypothetical protein [Chitinophagaceae bacterium]
MNSIKWWSIGFGAFNKTYVYNQDGTLNTFTDQKGNAFGYSYNPDGTSNMMDMLDIHTIRRKILSVFQKPRQCQR